MEEKLLKIINHHGINTQQRKLAEEIFELQEAITEYEVMAYECGPSTEYIKEELADVMVLLEQFKLYYGITSEEITDIFWKKVDRTLERMEK